MKEETCVEVSHLFSHWLVTLSYSSYKAEMQSHVKAEKILELHRDTAQVSAMIDLYKDQRRDSLRSSI